MIRPEEITPVKTDDSPQLTEAGKRARVLLVEDDKALRRYLEVTLERAGYEVVSAADGLEAIRTIVGRDAIFQLSIGWIQIGQPLAQAGASESHHQGQVFRETLRQLQLEGVIPVRAV